MREDPTFRVHVDKETSETIISGWASSTWRSTSSGSARVQGGMHRRHAEGELPRSADQGDAVRLQAQEADRRLGPVCPRQGRFGASARRRARAVHLRERGHRRPHPREYIPSVEKVPRLARTRAPSPATRCSASRWSLQDGSYHDVDSSDMAFQIFARDCFRETFRKADPVLLEPIMKVEVEVPTEFQGPVTGAISSKRGVILGTEGRDRFAVIPPKCRFGDVRLLQRPPEHDPRQGLLQHGVPQVPEAALAFGRSSRRPCSRRPRPETSESESRKIQDRPSPNDGDGRFFVGGRDVEDRRSSDRSNLRLESSSGAVHNRLDNFLEIGTSADPVMGHGDPRRRRGRRPDTQTNC